MNVSSSSSHATMDQTDTFRSVELAEVAEVIFSNVDKLSDPSEIPVKLCNYTDVYYNRKITSSLPFMNATATEAECKRFGLKRGDVVITKDSEAADDIAVPAYVATEIPSLVCGYHLAIIRPNLLKLDGRYLTQLLQLQRTRHYFFTLANGVTRFGLGVDVIRQARLHLPNVGIQSKISDILTTWDEALEKVDALIEAKERRKKALMQQLLTGKKRVKGFSEPWIRTRMSTFLTRVFRPIEWHPDLPLSLVSLRRRFGGLFRRPDVLGSEYKTRDLHELKKDDFLISKRQVVHGAWAFVTSEFEATHVSKEYVILISSAPDRLYMPFFGWFAQTPRMLRLARVSSTGVHIEKLIFDADVFLKEAIRIPQNIDEQRAISEILNNADREIRLLRTERGALDQQKRGLMQRLLTGKVRVKV